MDNADKRTSTSADDSGIQDPRLSSEDRVAGGPGHKAMSPAPPNPRRKQRGGQGPGDRDQYPPSQRPKRRGGSAAGEQA